MLIRNGIRTPDGTEIFSQHRHDYVSHLDKNGSTYAVDGGISYLRRSFTRKDYEELSVSLENVTLPEAAKITTWGTRGKNGDEPLKYIPISEMSLDHLEAVLATQTPAPQLKLIMEYQILKMKGDY
jgi:hypothetical protein